MNPAAPMWHSSNGNPQQQHGGRSMLDPNSAAFWPKPLHHPHHGMNGRGGAIATASAGAASGAYSSPTTPPLTRYAGNSLGGMNGYPPSQPYSSARGAYSSQGPFSSGQRGGSLVGGSVPPYAGGMPNAVNSYHHGGRGNPMAGHGGGGAFGAGGINPAANGGQLYSAKANTHWGSAGPPQNAVQQHTVQGAVLYNQPPLHAHHASLPSQPAAAPKQQYSKSTATPLREEIFLHPTTSSIWSGATAEPTQGVPLDSALPSDETKDHNPHTAPLAGSSVTVAPDAIFSTLAVPPGLSPDGNVKVEAEVADAAWAAATAPDKNAATEANPWNYLLQQPAVPPSINAKGAAEDHVSVQDLLAQLTQESPTRVDAVAAPSANATKWSEWTQSHHTESPSSESNSKKKDNSAATTPSKQQEKVFVSHNANHKNADSTKVAAPPSAIGSSPTSPEQNGSLQTESSHVVTHTESPVKLSEPNPMRPVPRSAAAKLAQQQQHHEKPPVTSAQPQQQQQQQNQHPAAAKKAAEPPVATASNSSIATAPLPAVKEEAKSNAPNTTRKWSTRRDVDAFLQNYKEVLRHIKILNFSKAFPDDVAKLFQGWAGKGIPAPDDVFGAYYYYVAAKSGMELCMKHNGRGRVPGVGYGGCDFATRGPNYRCRFHHVCLFCKSPDHGWFDELKCERYKSFKRELDKLKLSDSEIAELVAAYDVTE